MASSRLRLAMNAPGAFFVDSTCIDCDLCRQIAPGTFRSHGDQSIVHRQPGTPESGLAALKALVTCPTASIGAVGKKPLRAALDAYPDPVEDEVYFCGFASEASFGAASYLVVRPQGNVLVDSPRFASQLVRRIEARGGARWIFLTHRDDVADHSKWARHFGAERVLHRADQSAAIRGVEHILEGDAMQLLDADLLAIPTPGHTAGHIVLLYRNRFLFSGDHLWWSPNRQGLHASRSVCWYSWEEQTRSMRRLLDYEFEWVLPGHGRRFHAAAAIMRRELKSCLSRMG